MATSAVLNNPTMSVPPNSLPTESDWAALGVTSGYSPMSLEELRMLIVGPPGDGKSTFLSSCPGTLILDFEKGDNGIPYTRCHRVRVKNYDHYELVLTKLEQDAASNRRVFKRVGIDTIDGWAAMLNLKLSEEKHVMDISEYGSQGAGYSILRARCVNGLERLERAGYSWTCIGHITEKTQTINNKEVTVVRPALYDSIVKVILRNSEIFAFIGSTRKETPITKKVPLPGGTFTEVVTGSQITKFYRMDMEAVGNREGRKRGVPTLPSGIDLPEKDAWQVFSTTYTKAVEEMKAKIASTDAKPIAVPAVA